LTYFTIFHVSLVLKYWIYSISSFHTVYLPNCHINFNFTTSNFESSIFSYCPVKYGFKSVRSFVVPYFRQTTEAWVKIEEKLRETHLHARGRFYTLTPSSYLRKYITYIKYITCQTCNVRVFLATMIRRMF
jgi:hypothetical protein